MPGKYFVQFVLTIVLAISFVQVGFAETPTGSVWDVWHADCLSRVKGAISEGYRSDFNESRIVCCSFFIDRKGEITGLKIHRSSGNRVIDKTAIEIIQNTAPFKPFQSLYEYKTGVIARFSKDVKLDFYEPKKMPPNYDDNRKFIESWLKKTSEKIKRYGTKKSNDPNSGSKWELQYQLAKPAKCTFRLGSNGEIYDLIIKESSGDPEIDKLALKLVKQVAPLHMVSVSPLNGANIDVIFAHDDVKLKFAESNSKAKN